MRFGRRAAFALVLGLACAAGAVAAEPGAAERHERGRAIYNYRCYFCHGYSGDARTVAASTLAVRPRDFTAPQARGLNPADIARAVRDGRPGTPMASFRRVLTPADIDAVAAFVHREFVVTGARNTHYHTTENGWPDHARYRDAFPFATGARAASPPGAGATAAERAGWRLFVSACITCHDRGEAVPAARAFQRADPPGPPPRGPD